MAGGTEGRKNCSGLCPHLPRATSTPDHPWGSPKLLQVLPPQRMRAHLREGLHLLQHAWAGPAGTGQPSPTHALLDVTVFSSLHLSGPWPRLTWRLLGNGGLRQAKIQGAGGWEKPRGRDSGVRLHVDPQDAEEPGREKPGWGTCHWWPDSSPSNSLGRWPQATQLIFLTCVSPPSDSLLDSKFHPELSTQTGTL